MSGELLVTIASVRERVSDISGIAGAHAAAKVPSGKGIAVGEPLRAFQGVLTGVPVFRGSEKQIMKSR